jgi:signal peptidase II
MVDAAERKSDRSNLWGSLSAFGLAIAVITAVVDQASKFWLLDVFNLEDRVRVVVTPFLDLVVIWNTGISYGLFQEQGLSALWALLAFKAVAVILLWVWLARSTSRLTAAALGLIIGGAVGNAIDRLHWPGVMDFVLLHIDTAQWRFNWYVFNLADAAIVVGVLVLLYASFAVRDAAKAP